MIEIKNLCVKLAEEDKLVVAWFAGRLEDAHIVGAFRDGELVGTAGFSIQQGQPNAHKGRLFGMYVRSSSRNLGVGRLLRVVEARTLIFIGMILTAGTMYQLVYFTNMTPPSTIISVTVIQGLGLGLVFVPLSTAAFATLPAALRTDGTAILTLVRNIGSSVGIPVVVATLVNSTSVMHAQLAEHITPFNAALQAPDVRAIIDPESWPQPQ